MPVIDHVLYAGCYLPARSTFIDCPCSLDPGPYGTAVLALWRAAAASRLLWRNLSAVLSSVCWRSLKLLPHPGGEFVSYCQILTVRTVVGGSLFSYLVI